MAKNNLNFFNMSNPPANICPCSYDKIRREYSFSYDEHGMKVLNPVREIDIQSEIQSYENDCNIYNILNKYLYGDTQALNQVATRYGDFVDTPKSLHEALNISLRLKEDFNNLKPDVKSKFNNDFNQYLTAISNGSIFNILKDSSKTASEGLQDELAALKSRIEAAEKKEAVTNE